MRSNHPKIVSAGVLPLESVPHPSLASLYPVLLALCKGLLESVDYSEMTSLEDVSIVYVHV